MYRLVLIVLALLSFQACADIPDVYQPVVIRPPFSLSERLIDLSDALEKARRESKPLYIYLGAADCPPCRDYGIFLSNNYTALKDAFDKVVVVDIRTYIKGPELVFKIGDARYSFSQFKSFVGDKNSFLIYPYYWLISQETLKQIKQLPLSSAKNYADVSKQIETLRFDAPRQPESRELSSFLASTYGIGYQPSEAIRKLWICPSDRKISPSGNTSRNWVCMRNDPRLRRIFVWRDVDDRAKVIEEDNFNSMGGAREKWAGEPSCVETAYQANAGKVQGRINDCSLPLKNNTFYASFYHFKHRDAYLTLVVRNASPSGSTESVKDDLREWINELQFLD